MAGAVQDANSGLAPAGGRLACAVALNVAALACGDSAIIANYNALLKQQKAVFATAYDAEARRFQASDGSGWRSAMDGHMTRLYNFFAQPPAQRGFCSVASRVAAEARNTTAPEFQRFSVTAIDRLDQPFQIFYRAYSDYQRDLAAWRAGGNREIIAVARPAVVVREAANTAPWRVQLGAFAGADAAKVAWADIRRRAPGLASFQPHYEAASKKGLIRLRSGPATESKRCPAAVRGGGGGGAGLPAGIARLSPISRRGMFTTTMPGSRIGRSPLCWSSCPQLAPVSRKPGC